ncbi:MAG: hypothetical protein H7Y11_03735, partial [Armatimonadetes bacterium]|nr:hypothetical protein [Anaerolineae bacterium]
TSAYYDVLFGASQAGGGYVLRVYHDGTQLNRADILPFAPDTLNNPAGITLIEPPLGSLNSLFLITTTLNIQIRILNGTDLSATINEQLLTIPQLPTPLTIGAVGVQVPAGAQVLLMQVSPGS